MNPLTHQHSDALHVIKRKKIYNQLSNTIFRSLRCNLKVLIASTATLLSSPTNMNLSSSLGNRLHKQPCMVTLMSVVAPESTHQVSLRTKAKLTLEQTRARDLPFFTCHVAYLGHYFFMCLDFLQKQQVNSSSFFGFFC